MIDSIFIGKVIYNKLSKDLWLLKQLTDVIKDKKVLKVYPLIANDDTTFPYVVYRKDNIIPSLSKDGYYEDQVDFSIIIGDINYNTCCEIANHIRELFEQMQYTLNNLNISNCHLVGISENWVENAFVQILSFTCAINN